MRKLISFIATSAILLNSFYAPLTVLAQELSPTPEATPEATSTPEPTPTPEETIAPTEEPTPTPSETPSEIATPTPEVTPVVEETGTQEPTDQPSVEPQAPESNPTTTSPPESPSPEASSTPTFTPVVTGENAQVSTQVVITELIPQTLQENNVIKLITDKLDYAPSEVAIISGTGFIPEKTYSLTVSSADDPATSTTVDITTNSNGEFAYNYQLDGNYRPNYLVEVKDGEELIASTQFTDSNPSSVTYCHATPPETAANGWNKVTSDGESILQAGHDGHTADIISAFQYCPSSNSAYTSNNSSKPCSRKISGNWKYTDYLSYSGKNLATLFQGSTGQQVLNNNCVIPQPKGTIIIIKDSQPDSAQDFAFTTTGAGLSPFSLDDDTNATLSNTKTFTNVNAGTYTVSETPNNDWDLTSIVCADPTQNSTGSATAPTATINLAAGETVTCTFTNVRKTGSIKIYKNIIPHFGWNEGPEYNMDLSGPETMSWTLGDQHLGGATVVTGNYTITESAYTPSGASENGYEASYECSDFNDSGSLVNSISGTGKSVSFTLQENHGITCTFTNKLLGKLTIIKDSQPNDTENFVFNVSTSTGIVKSVTLDDDGETHNRSNTATFTLPDAAYTVTESEEDGSGNWHLTNATCTGPNQWGFSGGVLHVDTFAGTEMVCTLINTKVAGHITVIKDLVPNSDSGRFNLYINSSEKKHSAGDGGTTGRLEYSPGRYTIAEYAHSGTDLQDYYSRYDCLDVARANESVASGAGTSQTIELHDGDDVVCTFTNIRKASVSGYKWNDEDGDGTWDGHWSRGNWYYDEPTLSGWRIFIDENGNNSYDSGERYDNTDSDGSYHFDLTPGETYKICEVEKTELGWHNSNDSLCKIITPSAGDRLEHRDFGNHQKGSIKVCKVILDPNGNITDGSALYGDTFTINWDKLAPTVFTAGQSPNEKLFSDSETNDTYCVTYDNVSVSTYHYSQEILSNPSGWATPKYNDQYQTHVIDLSDFYTYGSNTDSNGEINLALVGPSRTLIVLNQYTFIPDPKIEITKSNDKVAGAAVGDTITYTLEVKNTGNVEVGQVIVKDYLPGGFSYISGSTSGVTTEDPTIEGSLLTWKLDDVAVGETMSLSYKVSITNEVSSGTFVNYATCKGIPVLPVNKVLTRLVEIDQIESDDTVYCNDVSSTVTIGNSVSYGGSLGGQVLGASTSVLPATGNPSWILIGAFGFIGAGLVLRKKYENK